jgi:hypothetical protein
MAETEAFDVEVSADGGTVRVTGSAAASTLMRLALAAKFTRDPSAEILLSPFVSRLIDELARVMPVPRKVDWDNPAIGTPPEFRAVADEVRRYHEVHKSEASVEALLALALKPFSVPLSRLASPEPGQLTDVDFDRLESLDKLASTGPWFVRQLDDGLAMSAVVVSTRPDIGPNEGMRFGAWPTDELVAATLLRDKECVVPADHRWDENAELIAAARNALGELVRLARLGSRVDDQAGGP